MIDPAGDIIKNRPKVYDFTDEILPYVRTKAQTATQDYDFKTEVANPSTTVSPLKGKFNITQQFGNYNPGLYAGITNDSRHKGLDLATPQGTEVFAPVSGKVQKGTDKNWGNYVDVIGDDGKAYRFSHLSVIEALADQIQAGQRLGLTGSTGNSTGAHLDLSVRNNGQFIDPLTIEWLRNYLMGGGQNG